MFTITIFTIVFIGNFFYCFIARKPHYTCIIYNVSALGHLSCDQWISQSASLLEAYEM